MVQRLQTQYTILIVFVIVFNFILISCADSDNDDDEIIESPFCDSLVFAIKSLDVNHVRPILNNLVMDLEPVPSDSDAWGHKDNLDTLVNRLDNLCDNMTFSLMCYACIYTNPPQSEIVMQTDSANISIIRILDILTPSNDTLSLVNIHP